MLVRNRPLIHRDDGFLRRRAVAEGAEGSLGVVVASQLLDDDLGFLEGVSLPPEFPPLWSQGLFPKMEMDDEAQQVF